jgi:hypothetical protein
LTYAHAYIAAEDFDTDTTWLGDVMTPDPRAIDVDAPVAHAFCGLYHLLGR